MNRVAQIRALAELDGFTAISDDGVTGFNPACGADGIYGKIPRYLEDLNEMQRLVMKVCPKDHSVRGYFNTQMERVMDDDYTTYAWEIPVEKWAEALLKTQTIRLWKDTE